MPITDGMHELLPHNLKESQNLNAQGRVTDYHQGKTGSLSSQMAENTPTAIGCKPPSGLCKATRLTPKRSGRKTAGIFPSNIIVAREARASRSWEPASPTKWRG